MSNELENEYDGFTEEELAELRQQEAELKEKIEAQLEQIGKLDQQWLVQHQSLLEQRKKIAKAFRERELEISKEKQIKARELRAQRQHLKNLKPRTLNEERINVSARLKALNCDPVEILAAIAMGDSSKLGTDENIRVFERRMASQELLSYVAPKIAAKPAQDDEAVETVPIFVPRRGDLAPQAVLDGDWEEADAD